MRIGLIDVDSKNYPNLPLMKISAWHKKCGDIVEWYKPLFGSYDIVYMSKVFSFTPDYKYKINNADKIIRGGTGYCINLVNGKEIYNKENDIQLPYEMEHIYPDYSLYLKETKDTAYGFLTRGCPRGCSFCHVEAKEGRKSYKVADLSEFWDGQKKIILCDPNILACQDWRSLFQQLIDSNAVINFNQGLDIRILTDEMMEMLVKMKIDIVHFAWDRYQDKDLVVPKFKKIKEITRWDARKLSVYCLTNFDTTFEQDLERVLILRDIGLNPYVMIYDKKHIDNNSMVKRLYDWVSDRHAFHSVNFDEYLKKNKKNIVKNKKLF